MSNRCDMPQRHAALDLTKASIVIPEEHVPIPVKTAARILSEEVGKRTGHALPVLTDMPSQGPVIFLTTASEKSVHGRPLPAILLETRAEGYSIVTETSGPCAPVIWIVGADPSGAVFGVGRLIRALSCSHGRCLLEKPLCFSSAPAYPIRGHQLGFRSTANTYDAWDVAQYEQYIRELTFFGANSIENIPFQDRDSPVMKVPRWEMNLAMSWLCETYGLNYWVWTPADFDLRDGEKRAGALKAHEKLAMDCPKLDAIFFPGGDPGDNPPDLVMPFLEEVSERLLAHHPKARIWISLQGFNAERVDGFYDWVLRKEPDWMGGVVAGPSSPPIPQIRARLPQRYGLRDYPDITHTVRAQYPTPWWDPAFAFTLGREPVNPEPMRYAEIHNHFAPYTQGFLSYSDGSHDDVNKTIWSARAWDPQVSVRDTLVEYSRVFFGPDVAAEAADGILCLEENWKGPLVTHAGVEATLGLWQGLEQKSPDLSGNWRWQMFLLRAYYDAHVRARLIQETAWETDANEVLALAHLVGADRAMTQASILLEQADFSRLQGRTGCLRDRIIQLCEDLFQSIGFQTSVEKYHASGAERGAVLDFIDIPLNNRWWLEDEFAKVKAMASEEEKAIRLKEIGTWERPEPGSEYDEVGNVAKSPHVIRGEGTNTDPNMERNPNPDVMWWNSGLCRLRHSWITKMDWPLGLRYEGLDSEASYVVRTTGLRDCLLKANGVRLTPRIDGKEIGEIKEFDVPKTLTQGRRLELTFDAPHEPDLNWRVQSRLTEVWLLKR